MTRQKTDANALTRRRIDVDTAAYLHAQGRSNKDIADLLGVTEVVVSRYLQQAREEGLIRINFQSSSLPSERRAAYEQRAFGCEILKQHLQNLANHLGVTPIRNISISYSGGEGTSQEEWDARIEHFGKNASDFLLTLLKKAEIVGITWGSTLKGIIDGLKALDIPSRQQKIQFFPTTGEPIGANGESKGSSSLAEQLDLVLNGGSKHCRSLRGIGAVTPIDFTDSEREIIKNYFRRSKHYVDIFDGEESLLDEADMIITSLGTHDQPWLMFNDELVMTGGIDREELSRLVQFDLGGALYPRPNLNADEAERFRLISGTWMGITMPHFLKVADKAARNGSPGVTIVALGKNKASVLLECCKLGLVNELIVDHDLAHELERLLK